MFDEAEIRVERGGACVSAETTPVSVPDLQGLAPDGVDSSQGRARCGDCRHWRVLRQMDRVKNVGRCGVSGQVCGRGFHCEEFKGV